MLKNDDAFSSSEMTPTPVGREALARENRRVIGSSDPSQQLRSHENYANEKRSFDCLADESNLHVVDMIKVTFTRVTACA